MPPAAASELTPHWGAQAEPLALPWAGGSTHRALGGFWLRLHQGLPGTELAAWGGGGCGWLLTFLILFIRTYLSTPGAKNLVEKHSTVVTPAPFP